jgi:hypothetical protein
VSRYTFIYVFPCNLGEEIFSQEHLFTLGSGASLLPPLPSPLRTLCLLSVPSESMNQQGCRYIYSRRAQEHAYYVGSSKEGQRLSQKRRGLRGGGLGQSVVFNGRLGANTLLPFQGRSSWGGSRCHFALPRPVAVPFEGESVVHAGWVVSIRCGGR